MREKLTVARARQTSRPLDLIESALSSSSTLVSLAAAPNQDRRPAGGRRDESNIGPLGWLGIIMNLLGQPLSARVRYGICVCVCVCARIRIRELRSILVSRCKCKYLPLVYHSAGRLAFRHFAPLVCRKWPRPRRAKPAVSLAEPVKASFEPPLCHWSRSKEASRLAPAEVGSSRRRRRRGRHRQIADGAAGTNAYLSLVATLPTRRAPPLAR